MDFKEIEERWQKAWEEAKIFEADPNDKLKFFITIPYPYLNGNLHVGHLRTFTIGDTFARFMRMKGYNVLFPMGFHVTGTPIIGLAELIKKRDQKTIEVYTKYHDVPLEDLIKLETPEKIVEYFAREAFNAMKSVGFSIDWRRVFTTTDPEYQKFIEWQFWNLKDKGLVVKGSHPVRYCPNDQNPVEDHDLLVGEEASIVEYTVVKFKLEDEDIIFPCATLRPETIYGVTNVWIKKDAKYLIAKVDGEKWFISREAFEKLAHLKKVEFIKEVDSKDFLGKFVIVPIVNRRVPILPADFVDLDDATGVVMSVPAHAPFDFAALKQSDLEPIVIIKTDIKGIPAEEAIKAAGGNFDFETLEKATKYLYKKEYHTGVMAENTDYPGLKVSEVKQVIHDRLIKEGYGDVFYEFSEKPVICRCGTKCIVKLVKDQWFINYSSTEWKKKVFDHLNEMKIIPDHYSEEFKNKVDWLRDKACARRKGLGTRLPWDKEWLIESLSDSTVYMVYYILAKFINEGKLKAENMVKEFFDYVFLGIGDIEEVSRISKLDKELLKQIRKEFLYWYPVDLRSSGKDLVANHLLFFLFHHVAIFPKELWPRAIAVNGYVSLEGQKMSKSKGPLLTIKKAVSSYGAEVSRLYILLAAEYDSDADWKSREVENLAYNLKRFFSIVSENYLKETKEVNALDRWLASKFNKIVKETNEAMEKLQTRRAVNAAFFEAMNIVRHYLRRGGKNLSIILDDWIKLLTPFIPHICEELWHIKHRSFVSLEKYPEFDERKIDPEAEAAEDYVMRLIEDLKEIKKFNPNAKVAYIVFAEGWKYKVAEALKKGKIRDLMRDEEFRKKGKEVSEFMKKVRDLVLLDEEKIVKENLSFIEEETGLKVSFDESEVPEEKKRSAIPGRPAIFLK